MIYAPTTTTVSTTNHIRLINVNNGAMLDEYGHYQTIGISPVSQGLGFYTSLSAELAVGQKIKFDIRPTSLVTPPNTPGGVAQLPIVGVYNLDARFEYVVKQYNIR